MKERFIEALIHFEYGQWRLVQQKCCIEALFCASVIQRRIQRRCRWNSKKRILLRTLLKQK